MGTNSCRPRSNRARADDDDCCLSLSTRVVSRIHSFLGHSQCHGDSRSGWSRLRCLSLLQAPWSAIAVISCASAASMARPRSVWTRAGGLQSPVLASHSPKASSKAVRRENFPLPTCCLLKNLEWVREFFVARSPSDARISLRSDPTSSESALLSGRERSLRSSASIISARCDAGAGSLRVKPVGRLWRVPCTSCISAHPTFCISMYVVPPCWCLLPLLEGCGRA